MLLPATHLKHWFEPLTPVGNSIWKNAGLFHMERDMLGHGWVGGGRHEEVLGLGPFSLLRTCESSAAVRLSCMPVEWR